MLPSRVSSLVTRVSSPTIKRAVTHPRLEEDEEEEKAKQKVLEEQYKPLLDWLSTQTKGIVADGQYHLPVTRP